MEDIHLVQCPSEIGAGTRGASLGPQAVQINAAEQNFPLFDKFCLSQVPSNAIFPYHAHSASLNYSQEFINLYKSIYETLAPQVSAHDRHLIFSGDHSSAGGLFGTFKDQMPDDKWGLIWIDAHGDLHTPYTTPSGNYHGMPVANILGLTNQENAIRDLEQATKDNWLAMQQLGDQQISPKLNPEDVFFIDIRDLEQEEWGLISHYDMAYTTPELRQNEGINGIRERMLSFAQQFEALYVSFDVDSLDAELVPGTGTPVENGLSWQEAETLIAAVWSLPQTKALEVTEINPLKDHLNGIAHHINKILHNVIEVA
jgi:arginase